MVENAPWRAHYDMRGMLQRVTLHTDRLPTAQRQNFNILGKSRQTAELFGHLIRQFARRAQHQRLSGVLRRVDTLQHAKAERSGFATAGFSLRTHIAASKDVRQCSRLDRRHRQIAHLFKIGQLAGG